MLLSILIAILGSSVITAVITGLFNKNNRTKILQDLWHADLEYLTKRVKSLEEDKEKNELDRTRREADIEELKRQNKKYLTELTDIKKKYASMIKENKALRIMLDEKNAKIVSLEARVAKLEEDMC